MSARLLLAQRLLLIASASIPFSCSADDEAPPISDTNAGGAAGATSSSAGAAGEAGSGGAKKPPTCVSGCSGTFCYDLVAKEKCEPGGYVVHGCQMSQGGTFSPDQKNPQLDAATGISSCCYSPGCGAGRPLRVDQAARISRLHRGRGSWV